MAKKSVHEQSTLILKPDRRAAGGLLHRFAGAIRAVRACAAEDRAGAIRAAAVEVRAISTLLDGQVEPSDGARDELQRLAAELLEAYTRLDDRTKDELEAAFRGRRDS
jgi:hypothetical protein